MALRLLNDPVLKRAYEVIVPFKWLNADPERVEMIGSWRRAKFFRDAAEHIGEAQAGCSDPAKFRRLMARASLDDSLLNEGWLHGGTGLDHIEFFYLVACFEEAIRRCPDSPLFRNGVDPDRASARGNRCSLAAEHMLCMFMNQMWTNCTQEALQMPFKVDQTTASRNIRLVRSVLANTNILPTDIVMMDEVRKLSLEEVEKLVKGGLSIDWTYTPIEAPVDKESNDEAYSGKEHTTACKKMHGCIPGGVIILGGPWTGGRGSEIADLRENLPDLGHLTASMTNPDTPADRRITVNLDGGPQGARDVLCGANVRMPNRTPPGGKLTREEIEYNNWLAGLRAVIENDFADIKDNGVFGTKFRGSVQDLEETGAIAVGLANLKKIRRRRKGFVPDTHRKQLKPGPKKPGPRGRKPRITFPKPPD